MGELQKEPKPNKERFKKCRWRQERPRKQGKEDGPWKQEVERRQEKVGLGNTFSGNREVLKRKQRRQTTRKCDKGIKVSKKSFLNPFNFYRTIRDSLAN